MGDGIDPRFDDQAAHQGSYPPDWDARRRATYQRDGYTCQNCGASGGPRAPGSGVRLHAHHVVPRSRGGSNALSNLQTLCESCHNDVHDHDITGGTVDDSETDSDWTTTDVSEDPHILLDLTWLVFMVVVGLLAGSVITVAGFIIGYGPHVMAAGVLVSVYLFGIYMFSDHGVVEPAGPKLFIVPVVLLALTLYAVLEGASIDFFLGVTTVFGSISLASRAHWFVSGHCPPLTPVTGPVLFGVTSTAFLGTLAWPIGETLTLASVGGVSAGVLTTPVGMAAVTAGFSVAFIVLALVGRFSARVSST